MPTPDTLHPWLSELPWDTVTELRVRSGESASSLSAVSCIAVSADKPCIDSLSSQVLADVDGADQGLVFRVLAYARTGKQVASRLFRPNTPSAAALDYSTDPLTAAVQQMASVVDRLATSNERLVSSLAQPVEALASLFRRQADETERLQADLQAQQAANFDLEVLAREAIQAANAEPSGPSPFQAEALNTLRAARSAFFPDGDPQQSGGVESDD